MSSFNIRTEVLLVFILKDKNLNYIGMKFINSNGIYSKYILFWSTFLTSHVLSLIWNNIKLILHIFVLFNFVSFFYFLLKLQ